ncbi:fluoride efflux transporter CrcB [Azospirillum lipoferum]|uniref:Fluoride-specific ion channel FluC n=1 Tax=Azospirillum lipoferum (strain 4B) TaxID=862719 RepID=G7Z210_AZOL4|nr:fluoride efflux transporter CrcB [Azospirillum lipoferum]CBS87401.1 putative membrane protein involved in chromosome condensation, CrcB-like [Azospirillum lipoferum 4B]
MLASPLSLLAVAVGGAAGSVARYLMLMMVMQWAGTRFPVGTIVVNVIGCTAMGVLSELAALAWSPSPELRALLLVGVLGGFTTFSSFTLDIGVLVARDEFAAAAGYFLASTLFSVVGFFAGLWAVRSLVSVSL